jgi:hypothetical protein
MVSALRKISQALGLRSAERPGERFDVSDEEFERRAARARARVQKMPRGEPLDPSTPEIIGR